ncbi:MAG: glycosyltransferase, partial [Mycobacterium sp.]|nr:glycosyltransferase [Mycobacterium sp.]
MAPGHRTQRFRGGVLRELAASSRSGDHSPRIREQPPAGARPGSSPRSARVTHRCTGQRRQPCERAADRGGRAVGDRRRATLQACSFLACGTFGDLGDRVHPRPKPDAPWRCRIGAVRAVLSGGGGDRRGQRPQQRSCPEALSGITDPRLRIIAERRRGVSHARNAGIDSARSPLAAFTDDDVTAQPDWLQHLVAVFDADPHESIGCVTGMDTAAAELGQPTQQLFEASSSFSRGYRMMVWDDDPSTLAMLSRHEPLATEGHRGPAFPIAGSEFGSGNNTSFRVEALRRLHGFDPVLGTGSPARGGEDLDMFRRLILADHAIVYQPAAIVRHRHRDTMAGLRRQMYDYGVGMSANVTRFAAWGRRISFLRLATVLPSGLRMLLAPSSDKNAGKATDYPRHLTLIELEQYVTGTKYD